MTQGNVYLDYNATAPIHPGLKEQIPQWLENWGNASSIHQHGRGAKKLVREARQRFAALIGAHPMELIFTSGGSEANNLAIKSFAFSEQAKTRNEIISTRVEHPSVLRTLEFMAEQGFKIHYIEVNRQGEMNMAQYKSLLSEQTLLVTIMAANNEIGTLFPVKKMATLAKAVGAYFHTDAVQTLGRMAFSVKNTDIDMASFSGHKFYALKGVGVLFCRRGTQLQNLIHGGGQERGRRAGTENVLAIASLGYMMPLMEQLTERREQMESLRDHMEKRIVAEIPEIEIIAKEAKRLPNTSCLLISGTHGESLLMSLDVKGFSVSTGAACSSGSPEPSHVLFAIGLTHDEAQSSLRVSLGWLTTREEIDSFVDTLKSVVNHLRSLNEEQKHEEIV